MKTIVAIVTAGVVLAASASAAVAPAIRVSGVDPFTVRGTHFKARERVTLVLDSQGRFTRVVTAGTGGGFVARFQTAQTDRCLAYTVRATGNRGSRAILKAPQFECPPPLSP